jgi:tRNA 2-thiouridine synthesizing protein B
MLILVKYGPENPGERWKLESATPEDQIVLIQNGIFWAIAEPEAIQGKKVAIVKPDLEARGYSAQACKLSLVDYAGLITLLEESHKSMS